MARSRGRKFAVVQVAVWGDPDFIALSGDEQWLYIAAISSPDLSYVGVLPLLPQRFARLAKGMTARRVEAALRKLHDKRYLIVDDETGEMLVRTYVRHDGVLKQPNVVRAMNKAFDKVHSESLRAVIREEVGKAIGEGFPQGLPQGLAQALREGFAEGFIEPLSEGVA